MAQISYIYVLVDPRDSSIRYCGQTLGPKLRLIRHIRETQKRQGRLTKKEAWIRQLLKLGLEPRLKVIAQCSRVLADSIEIDIIRRLRAKGYQLTNTTDGGNGRVISGLQHPNYGRHLSKITRQRIGTANSGPKNGMFGKSRVLNAEQRQQLSTSLRNSTALKKRHANPIYRRKISDAQSEELLVVSSITGKVLMRFRNCHEAANTLGCTYGNIKNARRDGRIIGKRLKTLLVPCYVIFASEFNF